jgi:hypothetical protein
MMAFNAGENSMNIRQLAEEFLKDNPGLEERFEVAANNNPELCKMATEGKDLKETIYAGALLVRIANCKTVEDCHELAKAYPSITFVGPEQAYGIRAVFGLGEPHGK